MVSQGNISGASRLATTPGVLKPSAAGSQIKHLGQGSEGIATMVAHPEHGVAVRKLYDPRGISGSDMIARKEQAGRAIGDNPHFAKFLGAGQTPHGGQMHFSEFVQQGKAPTGQAGAQSVKHTQVQANKALNQAGFAGGKDIRSGNMVYDQASGNHKVIDYIPAKQNEFMRMPKKMENFISTTPDAPSPWNQNYESGGSSQGGMLGRLLGGKSSPGVRGTGGSLGTAPTAVMGTGVAPTIAAKPQQQQQATTPMRPIQPPSTTPMRPQKPAAPATVPMKPPKPAVSPGLSQP